MSPVTQSTAPEFMRIREAAQFIGMSVGFLRKEAHLGRGPQRIRVGKAAVYSVESLRNYMASRIERNGK